MTRRKDNESRNFVFSNEKFLIQALLGQFHVELITKFRRGVPAKIYSFHGEANEQWNI